MKDLHYLLSNEGKCGTQCSSEPDRRSPCKSHRAQSLRLKSARRSVNSDASDVLPSIASTSTRRGSSEIVKKLSKDHEV